MYKKNAFKNVGNPAQESDKRIAIHRSVWPANEPFWDTYNAETHTESNVKTDGIAIDQVQAGYQLNANLEAGLLTSFNVKDIDNILAKGINKSLAATLDYQILSTLADHLKPFMMRLVFIVGRYGIGWKQLKEQVSTIDTTPNITDAQKRLVKYLFNSALQQSCGAQITDKIGYFNLSQNELDTASASWAAIQKGILISQGVRNMQTFFSWESDVRTEYLVAIRTPFMTLKKLYTLGAKVLMKKIRLLPFSTGQEQSNANEQIVAGSLQMGQGLRNQRITWVDAAETRLFGLVIPPNTPITIPVVTYLICFAGENLNTTPALLRILYQFAILSIYMQITYQNDSKSKDALNTKFKYGGMVSHALKVDSIFQDACNDLQDNGYESILASLRWDKYKEVDLDNFILSEAERDYAMVEVLGKKVPNAAIPYTQVYDANQRRDAASNKDDKILQFILRNNKHLEEEKKYDEPENMQPQQRR